MLVEDIVSCEACTGVPFSYSCMERQVFTAQQFGPCLAVADVMERAKAVDFRRIGEIDADVV